MTVPFTPGVPRAAFVALMLLTVASSASFAQAGQPEQRRQPPRRQETIEIRGQVPTPQVVTVRPREAPAYSRRVLVPAYFDRDFWPSILPPLRIVPASASPAAAPGVRTDSLARPAADSAARPPAATRPSPGMSPAPPR